MKAPTPASILRAHPQARGPLSVTDGTTGLGSIMVDDAGRGATKPAWAWSAGGEFVGEFGSRVAAVCALPGDANRGRVC